MIGVASILTIVGAISYAYFSAMGDMTSAQGIINTATVSARFTDNDPGITGELSFGQSLTKKFTITNTGTADATVNMYWDELSNTYLDGSLTYTLSYSETETGTYTEIIGKTNVPKPDDGEINILATNLTIPVGKTYYYNLIVTLNYLNDVNQDADLNAKFHTNFGLKDRNYQEPVKTASEMTLATLKANSNGIKPYFDSPATTDEGIFEMEDDYGTSYYYRGAVTNNYVKFARIYWRIIRINGDGSLRIIYDGKDDRLEGYEDQPLELNNFIAYSHVYNANYNDAKYVGWMYGPTGTSASTSKEQAQTNTDSSDIKKTVDQWYEWYIKDMGFENAVADVLFCNDRSIPGKTATALGNDTELGYGKNVTGYGAAARVGVWNLQQVTPTFKCPNKNDAFTVSDEEKGNGALTYPIGLITADEVITAGSGQYNMENKKYYLYRDATYWTISPSWYNGYTPAMLTVGGAPGGATGIEGSPTNSGQLQTALGNETASVAPVINLSAEYVRTMIGDGTLENPYRVE